MRIGTIIVIVAALCLTVASPTLAAAETAGIGVVLKQKGEVFVVMRVLPDSPAALNPGIQTGDRILAIGQENNLAVDVAGLKTTAVIDLLRGPAGSRVRLTMLSEGKELADARVVSLVRGELKTLARWGNGVLLPAGSQAPDLEILDLASDKTEHLADFRGQVVVLKFWATWCGPCQKQIADLQDLSAGHPEWKGKVAFITVSVDDEKSVVIAHLKEKGWNKTHNVWLPEEVVNTFHVNSLPTTYVIDAQGKVAAVDSASDLSETLNELLEEN